MLRVLAAPPLAYAAYVASLLKLGPRRLAWLLHHRQLYNGAMAAYSLAAAIQGLVILFADGRLASPYALVCTPSASWPWFWLASKFVEFTDTAFIVARARLPTRLHALHHALTPSMVLLDTHVASSPSPLFLVATVLNLLTHSAMYMFYSDPPRFAAFKSTVTRIQIGQHATLFALLFGTLALANRTDCDVPAIRYKVALCFYAWMVNAFMRLYVLNEKKKLT